MHENDWPTTAAVKSNLDEEIVQEAMSSDDGREGLVLGIQDALAEGDEAGAASGTALLAEADRRRHVQDYMRAVELEVEQERDSVRAFRSAPPPRRRSVARPTQ